MSGFERFALRYVLERLATPRIAALCGVTAALAAGFGHGPAPLHAVACTALILELRIVDDLLDLAHDCRAWPQRALCAASRHHRLTLGALAGSALALTAAIYVTRLASAQALLGFGVGVAVLYAPAVPRSTRRFGLLLKYPALVVLGSAQALWAVLAALAWAAFLFALEAHE